MTAITFAGRGCGVRQETHIPGALSILRGAVPGLVRGPGHTAPTYVVGSRDRSSNGFRGSALLSLPPAPAEIKEKLRQQAFSRRAALDRDWRREASRAIAERVLAMPELSEADAVGAYWPIGSEVDPRPIMRGLVKRGQDVALSQVIHPKLSWRLWRPGDPLVTGGFGVREPGPDAPEVFPAALLVPLAAFDRRGWRIGYGKGHFDRAIAALAERRPLMTVGLAFSVQEVDSVPVESHDRPLDRIVTEIEVIIAADRG
jgi:5-formyltetrahydrofolate cyclo-ligase